MNEIERQLRRIYRQLPLWQQWTRLRARFMRYFRSLERGQRLLLSLGGLALGGGCLLAACLICSLVVLLVGRGAGF